MTGKLRPYDPLLAKLIRLGDAFIAAGLFLSLCWLYGMNTRQYLEVVILIFLMTMVCFHAVGLYQSWRMRSTISEIYQIILGCICVYAFLLLIGFALKVSDNYSRRLFLTWAITWPCFMGIGRFFMRSVLRHYRKKGYNTRWAIVAGAGKQGERLVEEIDGHPWSGIRVVGFFDDRVTKAVKSRPVLGTLKELPAYVQESNVDVVYLALTMKEETKIHWLLKKLADTTVSVYHIPDIFFFDLFLGGSLICVDKVPIIPLRESPLQGMNALLKRTVDLVFASIILILICPIMLAISIGIKLTSSGPILFKQWRYGIDGRAIKVYKFRTMTVCEDGYSFTQAIRCDSRVTWLGAFLRGTSLDELPQFFNVLQGRMSIVGPRPHAVAMNEEYRKLVPGYMIRHKVKPGITGLAQVNGWRGETEALEKMEKRVECDLEYLRQWSLLLDLKIMAQTIFNGSWRTNAH